MSFYTTSTSNLAGLSALAYGSSLRFRETKNEVISRSLNAELFRSRPSQLLMSIFPSTSALVDMLLPIFNQAPDLEKLFLLNKPKYNTRAGLLSSFIKNFEFILDTHSYYDLSLQNIFKLTLDTLLDSSQNINTFELGGKMLSLIEKNQIYFTKLKDFYSIIANNHFAKISDLPDNQIIRVSPSADMDSDWRGLSVSITQIPPQKYFSNSIYRSTIGDFDTFSQNYFTYLGTHVQSPAEYNGYDSENYATPTSQASDVIDISLINARKGLYL
jgi:hypothetical protein